MIAAVRPLEKNHMTLQGLRDNLSLVMLASVFGKGRPVRSGLEVCARMLGLPPPDVNGIYLGPMSQAWLRHHDADAGKHDEFSG